jgi:hypothetical protein
MCAQIAFGLWFGAKAAQSETPVRAAAERRPTRMRAKWEKERRSLPFHKGG